MRPTARSLATILFTDIVGSTVRAAELGDRRWRELLARHHAAIRRELRRFGGRDVKRTGDGFLALFERPARAILCATAVRDSRPGETPTPSSSRGTRPPEKPWRGCRSRFAGRVLERPPASAGNPWARRESPSQPPLPAKRQPCDAATGRSRATRLRAGAEAAAL